jgi:hypothetical protein
VFLFGAIGGIFQPQGFNYLIAFKECAVHLADVMSRDGFGDGFSLSWENALRRAARLRAFVNHDDLDHSCASP